MKMFSIDVKQLEKMNGMIPQDTVRAVLESLDLKVWFLAPGAIAIVDNNFVPEESYISGLHPTPEQAFAEALEKVQSVKGESNSASVRCAVVFRDRIEGDWFATLTLAMYKKD
jgi:hypothetical protein